MVDNYLHHGNGPHPVPHVEVFILPYLEVLLRIRQDIKAGQERFLLSLIAPIVSDSRCYDQDDDGSEHEDC